MLNGRGRKPRAPNADQSEHGLDTQKNLFFLGVFAQERFNCAIHTGDY